MGMKFLGEQSAELLAWPESERRHIYLQAVRCSYLNIWTWAGFIISLPLIGCSRLLIEHILPLLAGKISGDVAKIAGALGAVITISGMILLGKIQVAVIRKELRKMIRLQAQK